MAFDSAVAVQTIYGEASGCSAQEQEAVAFVIRNRMKLPQRFGATAASVCHQHQQFSCWWPISPNVVRMDALPEDDRVLNQCKVAWAWSSSAPDFTNGATHYFDKSIAAPYWATGAILTLATPNFRFYSGVK